MEKVYNSPIVKKLLSHDATWIQEIVTGNIKVLEVNYYQINNYFLRFDDTKIYLHNVDNSIAMYLDIEGQYGLKNGALTMDDTITTSSMVLNLGSLNIEVIRDYAGFLAENKDAGYNIPVKYTDSNGYADKITMAARLVIAQHIIYFTKEFVHIVDSKGQEILRYEAGDDYEYLTLPLAHKEDTITISTDGNLLWIFDHRLLEPYSIKYYHQDGSAEITNNKGQMIFLRNMYVDGVAKLRLRHFSFTTYKEYIDYRDSNVIDYLNSVLDSGDIISTLHNIFEAQ